MSFSKKKLLERLVNSKVGRYVTTSKAVEGHRLVVLPFAQLMKIMIIGSELVIVQVNDQFYTIQPVTQ